MASFLDRLIGQAVAERDWWSDTQASEPAPADPELRKRGLEVIRPYRARVARYWKEALDIDGRDGLVDIPWSAAFISWCMVSARDGGAFPKAQGHSGYIRASARNYPNSLQAPFVGYPPLEKPVKPGDVIGAARYQEGRSYVETYQQATAMKDYPSHCDIVVAVRPGAAVVVGGNVTGGRVGEKHVALDANGYLIMPPSGTLPPDQRKIHPWIVLIRSNL